MRMLAATLLVSGALALGSLPACDSGDDNGADEQDQVAPEEDLAQPPEKEDGTGEEDVAALPETSGEDAVQQPELPPDLEPPVVVLNLKPLTALQGEAVIDCTFNDNVAVTKVEVLVDGAVAAELDLGTFKANTSNQDPGQHDLALKAYDAAGLSAQTEAVPVMLAGPGQFLDLVDGFPYPLIPGWWAYKQSVFVATEVPDMKGHVVMPEAMKQVKAFFKWEGSTDSEWELGFDIGTGGCPHSGQLLAAADYVGANGMEMLGYADPAGKDLAPDTWFAHVRFTDGLEHKGESVTLHVLWLALP